MKAKMPLVPGHEGVGIVTQVGERVTKYKVGDRVGIAWLHSACGTCEYCLTGWETLCYYQEATGNNDITVDLSIALSLHLSLNHTVLYSTFLS